ncbi:MAG: MFS transporter [Bdellovibrionales bacterium]|nr:MFS transporter [Bdellovibrionales bacterium]
MSFSTAQERKIVALLGAVQFVNVLDFMMVMPLGPDFASALGIETSKLGWIGGSYMASASLAGLVGSFFLDRFDRKTALLWCLAGLGFGTLLGGFTSGFASLLGARVFAGLFGGPASSLTFSLAADVVPVARRGRAMSALMSAFAVASVFGVPAGLELARIGGWRAPFFGVGGLALVVWIAAARALPSQRGHIAAARGAHPLRAAGRMLRRRPVWFAYGCMAAAMVAGFLMIPNMAAFFEFNLAFPREKLGLLYLVGGIASFALMIGSGRLIDRFGASLIGGFATALLIAVTYFGFVRIPSPLPPIGIFVGFMAAMGVRGVATTAVASRVPPPHERARFVSFMSVFQHAASALGAFLSASLLAAEPGGRLVGMDSVAQFSIAFSVFIMVFLVPLERGLNRAGADSDVA